MLTAIDDAVRQAGIRVERIQLEQLAMYADELLKWNIKINLTAITERKAVAAKHIVDALFFAQRVESAERVLDVGSGAGIPAIPLKIMRPEIEVVSVDSVAKKIMFQRHAARSLGLTGFEVLHARVEELSVTGIKPFDVIVSRAFSNLSRFVILVSSLLATGGRIVAMKGPALKAELDQADELLAQLGYEIRSENNYVLPYGAGQRSLLTITMRNNF
ncbi:MAG TPA: 16S rRNA (guanine(527)-N(7))-methyltransferase RsmG [Deltaproteobacteria bacterium]|nr:16S rRNA (guanine(527)-N(7))-methyltransferase RsmG [Deltaproteobacteria bacterium]HQB37772.1 16S rRNA (guanine(527)-N(7))-methyltransferase RsmG [Deltaproteobacteria bacterium]